MRYGWLALGVALGAGAYVWYSSTYTGRSRRRWRPSPEPKHQIQGPDERAAVADMIDEIVHDPAVPETPVKQAFEQALEQT